MEESIENSDQKVRDKLLNEFQDIKQKLVQKNRLSNLDLIEYYNKSADGFYIKKNKKTINNKL